MPPPQTQGEAEVYEIHYGENVVISVYKPIFIFQRDAPAEK